MDLHIFAVGFRDAEMFGGTRGAGFDKKKGGRQMNIAYSISVRFR